MPNNKKLSKGQKKKAQARRKKEREEFEKKRQEIKEKVKNTDTKNCQEAIDLYAESGIVSNGGELDTACRYEVHKHKKLIEENEDKRQIAFKMTGIQKLIMGNDFEDDRFKYELMKLDAMDKWSTIMIELMSAYGRFLIKRTKKDAITLKGIKKKLMEVMYEIDEAYAGMVANDIMNEDEYNTLMKNFNNEVNDWGKFENLSLDF
tara:strand:- start:735 stop:1349 length:615 start_codon:yes stop_codon:yes gene_type:complete